MNTTINLNVVIVRRRRNFYSFRDRNYVFCAI